MKVQHLCTVILFMLFMLSCSEEEQDDVLYIPTNVNFTDSELALIEQTLDLPASPYNYANLPLPDHFKTDEATELDNTPANNPITDIGATLGRVLFYDKNLSANNTVSCASCHQQSAAFADNLKFSEGFNGALTRRNSMGLINSRYYENGKFQWDERAETLEDQVLMPIQNHKEMGLQLAELEAKLEQLDYYEILFEKSFGSDEISSDRIAKALAQFIRSMVSFNSKFDEGLIAAGNPDVYEDMPDLPNFNEQEKLGMDIFLRGRNGATCGYCHGGAQNVNDAAKNNGLDLNYADKGKGEFTGNSSDFGLFKVPSLRNIALTAPYMHDGRFETLMEVVEHYNNNIQAHPNLNFRLTTLDDGDEEEGEVLKLYLSQEEKEAVVAFLHTLTDQTIINDEKYSDPFK